MNKNIKILVLFLIIIIVSLTIYFVVNKKQNSKEEFADWKIYTNKYYGISMSYPASWELEEVKELYLFTVFENQISRSCILTGGSLGEGTPSGYAYTTEKVIIDDKEFVQKKWESISGISEKIFINDGFQLIKYNFNPISQKCLNNLNQILSTFKFIN